jgi:hypothetical protein
VTEEQTFRVWLVAGPANNSVDGTWVYRAEALPERKQVIEVEAVGDPGNRRRARVSRLEPDDDFPIRATELGDETDV